MPEKIYKKIVKNCKKELDFPRIEWYNKDTTKGKHPKKKRTKDGKKNDKV